MRSFLNKKKIFYIIPFLFILAVFSLLFTKESSFVKTTIQANKKYFYPAKGMLPSKWYVTTGDRICKGQLLFEYDLSNVLAEKKVLEKKLILEEKQAHFIQVNIEKHTTEYINAKQKWALGEVDEHHVDVAVNTLQEWQANLDCQNAAIELTKQKIVNLEQELTKSKVYSPVDGIVSTIEKNPSSNEALCIVNDIKDLYISYEAPKAENLQITLPSQSNKKVSYFNTSVEKIGKNKAKIISSLQEKEDIYLIPGMEVEISWNL